MQSEFFAEYGQAHLSGAPLEESCTQFSLKLFDLHGQGGLGDRAGRGGVAEMAVMSQGFEITELF